MEKFFQELINSLTIESILSKPIVNSDFKFKNAGWYFFISPISGLLKIKIIRTYDIDENVDVTRFIKCHLIIVIGCEGNYEFFTMYEFARDNLNIINEIQKQAIKIVSKNKFQINEPGTYRLKLLDKTISYTNNDPYYLFNGIDAQISKFYLDGLSSGINSIDDYLNDPFYYFMYDLDGFMIYEKYVDYELKIGGTYECKVDFINRNSSFSRQLAIRKIYSFIKTDII